MKNSLKIILHTLIFILLTAITQIGGVIYLLSLFVNTCWKIQLKFKSLITFLALYICFTILIIPIIAPIFGRERVKHSKLIRPTNYMTVLLNRNYVKPALNDLLAKAQHNLQGTHIKIHYLDANFPFINSFPLLPHLSHNDGKKIDISLIYETGTGELTDKQKSISGYGVFEPPKNGEINQIQKCIDNGYFQYNYAKYLTFGKINNNLVFSDKGTKKLINSFLKAPQLGKVFIEPHLKQRLNLLDSRIRFHGCRAVRHDDHIHFQLK